MVDQHGLPASPTIQRKACATLRNLLGFAARKGDRQTIDFTFPKMSSSKRTLVTLDETGQQVLVDYFEQRHPGMLPFIKWTARKPHRTNENRAFRVRDFDFSAGTYKLNGAFDEENYKPFPKVAGRAGAEFEMDAEDIAIVREALKDRIVQPDSYIFVNPRNGKAITHHVINNIFYRARQATGYTEITLEQFGRHSWVKKRLDAGWGFTQISHYTLNNVATLQKFYANVTVTNRKVIDLRTNPRLKKASSEK